MADAKISALTSLTGSGVTTADDVVPIVDTSATTTKKITVDELAIALNSVPATQAQMETGTSTVTTVTPGRQHYHLMHPKAIIKCSSLGSSPFTATALASGLGSLTPTTNGTGDWTLAWTNTLTNPAVTFSCEPETTTAVRRLVYIRNGGLGTTSLRFVCYEEGGVYANPSTIYITFFGDLA